MKHLLWLPLALWLFGCGSADPVYNTRFLAFGTLMDLSIIGVPRADAEAAAAAIEVDFQAMHHLWHAWDPGPLGRVNRLLPGGERFAAPPSVLPLIRIGQQLSVSSDGLFNPAIGKLVDIWGFHRDDPSQWTPPPDATIQAFLEDLPQMADIEIDGLYLRGANPNLNLDFGAFGKGYGIDLAIRHLRELGIENAIINAGGDLRAIGSRDNRPWRIAIRRPTGAGVLGTIDVSQDEAVFTSGDYERKFKYQGKRYHHIIDPRTGYPAQGSLSVTVLHSNATIADAAATALFIAGPDGWYDLARRMGIPYVLLVDSHGVIHMNPEMAARVKLWENAGPVELSPPLHAARATGAPRDS